MRHEAYSISRIFGMVGMLTALAVILNSEAALAQVEQQNKAQEGSVVDADASPPPAGDVNERGIQPFAPRAGMGATVKPGVIGPTVTEPTGFKCSPNSGQCRSSGAVDSKYMKDLLTGSCPNHTCTGSGANQKCCCVIGGGTCTP